uniref:Uncharacterized protein n=1 Tax=Meloidogyne javanica TaxID=6303 RepID=A0A915NAQ3_MELJA
MRSISVGYILVALALMAVAPQSITLASTNIRIPHGLLALSNAGLTSNFMAKGTSLIQQANNNNGNNGGTGGSGNSISGGFQAITGGSNYSALAAAIESKQFDTKGSVSGGTEQTVRLFEGSFGTDYSRNPLYFLANGVLIITLVIAWLIAIITLVAIAGINYIVCFVMGESNQPIQEFLGMLLIAPVPTIYAFVCLVFITEFRHATQQVLLCRIWNRKQRQERAAAERKAQENIDEELASASRNKLRNKRMPNSESALPNSTEQTGGGENTKSQKRKNDERERKKAEVRKRLEEAGRMKKAKKKLLMMKAAEDLKKQQMLKEQERQSVLNERIVPLPELESSGEDELQRISKEFAESVIRLEREKYDLSYTVRQKDFEINELTIAVNDLRGKLFGIFKN